jgi:hypothetical protein
VLGNYNTVRAPNIGAPCTSDAACYSPFGHGRCDDVLRGDERSCTVLDCAAPGVPSDVCGDPDGSDPMLGAATCITIGSDSVCRETCLRAATCPAGAACMPADVAMMVGIGAAHAICTPFCFGTTQAEADAQCRPGTTCGGDFVPGMALGVCG